MHHLTLARAARKGRAAPLVLALVLVVAVAAAFFAWRGRGPRRIAGEISSVAVLPLVTAGSDTSHKYLGDGLTEELIRVLERVPGLRVANRSSVLAFDGAKVDARAAARTLQVEAALQGTVTKNGSALRIETRLVSARDGRVMWNRTFDLPPTDIFAAESGIARGVAASLGADSVRVTLLDGAMRNAEAYELFLKARDAWDLRTRIGLSEATEYFGQATVREPAFARAYAGLSEAYAVNGFFDYMRPRDAYPHAALAARRSLAADSTLASPHATIGYIATYFDWDFTLAEQELRRAITMDPDDPTAHQWYANLLTAQGRFADAEREMRTALADEPTSPVADAALGWAHLYAGKFDRALAQFRRALTLDPDDDAALLWSGQALDQMGKHEEALTTLRRADSVAGHTPLTRSALARAFARGAQLDSARRVLIELEARGRREYVPSYELARIYLALGDTATALDRVEVAASDHEHSIALMRVDPQLAPLRGNIRFRMTTALVRFGGAPQAKP